ncbi:unnamed protein product [Prunus armeniaca]
MSDTYYEITMLPKLKRIHLENPKEIPIEVIAESVKLAKKQQDAQGEELTHSKLALFDDVETENYAIVPPSEVEKDRIAEELAVVTSSFKPMIVGMPLHSVPGSSTTASYADPELAEFEVMDLEAQLLKIEKLGATPSKSKSKAVDELDLDGNKEAID